MFKWSSILRKDRDIIEKLKERGIEKNKRTIVKHPRDKIALTVELDDKQSLHSTDTL